MKADPGTGNGKGISFRILLGFSLLLLSALLVAGCDEPPDKDIVIVKISPDALAEWSRAIDTGMNDEASQIIQTSDGNFVIYRTAGPGGYGFSGLEKIAERREHEWTKPRAGSGCGHRLIIGRNGDLIAAGGRDICRIAADGTVIWNRTLQTDGYIQAVMEIPGGYIAGGGRTDWVEYGRSIEYDASGNATPQMSEKEKREKGIPVTQAMVARLDTDGEIVWLTLLGRDLIRDPVEKIIRPGNYPGYIVRAGEKIVRLDENGTLAGVTWITDLPEADAETLARTDLVPDLTYPQDFVLYDSRGESVAKQKLQNISVAIRTQGGGFLAAGFPGKYRLLPEVMERAQDGNLFIVRFRPDGSREWERPVNGVQVNAVSQILQTSDGGYALLCANDKRYTAEESFRI